MPIILPPRCESHEHLGQVVILDTDDGWAEVGENENVDRRLHWFRFRPIAVRCEIHQHMMTLKPFLTLAEARKAMISGMYHEKRQHNPSRLRAPDDLIRPIYRGDLNQPLVGLKWYEANALCELRYGRLPTEKEVDLIFHHLSQYLIMPSEVEQIWTCSTWSHWNYALCGYDAEKQRWYSAEELSLIDENDDNPVSVFNRKPVHRESFSPDTKKATIGTLIVFDLNKTKHEANISQN